MEPINPETSVQMVSANAAKTVAERFNPVTFFNTANPTNHSPVKSKLNGNNTVTKIIAINDRYNNPAIYVCNFADNQGFLFVAADYQIAPILAYIEMGEFKKDKVPSGLVSWADKTIENIEAIRKGSYTNTKEAKVEWDNYMIQNPIASNQNFNPNPVTVAPFYIAILPGDPVPLPTCVPTYRTVTIGPLLATTWGQECSYNDLCALNQNFACNIGFCGNGRPYTGCAATASAQVIRYWQPQILSNYNYASMPNTFGNNEVQRLMSDVGQSVSMSYGCNSSSANTAAVQGALLYYRLGSAIYDDYKWWVTAGNLDNHWPVLLDGCAEQTENSFIINWWTTYSKCHLWVTDGYQQNIWTTCNTSGPSAGRPTYNYGFLYLHMNWGWHEDYMNTQTGLTDYNGWFMNQNWNIEGRNLNFQYRLGATTKVHL